MRGLRKSALIAATCAILLAGCAPFMPASGPVRADIDRIAAPSAVSAIQVVDVDDALTRRLLGQQQRKLFSETLGNAPDGPRPVGRGDRLEVTIWEAAPATLFNIGVVEGRGMPQTAHATTLPEQTVDETGEIVVPFAGRIKVDGRTLVAIESEIVKRLTGKANQPSVLVRRTANVSSSVTVVGEVTKSARVPLTPGSEHLLDVIAAAAGVRQPVDKTTIQVTRGASVQALPLGVVIRDPRQNIALAPGDVVTAIFQPLSFTALGATGKNNEISFEAQGITLAQALARVGGILDERADSQGVFIFRFEPKDALDWPKKPVLATPEGRVPVVYRIDLKDPGSFFVMQNFAVNDKDLIYVSNAPMAELQKFLNVVFSVAYPVLTAVQVTQ